MPHGGMPAVASVTGNLFDRRVAGEAVKATSGLPIGNLTSQTFANWYLTPFDHWLSRRLPNGNYLRRAIFRVARFRRAAAP